MRWRGVSSHTPISDRATRHCPHPHPQDSHTALALPASSSPTRPGLELSTSPGALARSLAMADLADSGSPGATMGGGALARAAELDMEKARRAALGPPPGRRSILAFHNFW